MTISNKVARRLVARVTRKIVGLEFAKAQKLAKVLLHADDRKVSVESLADDLGYPEGLCVGHTMMQWDCEVYHPPMICLRGGGCLNGTNPSRNLLAFAGVVRETDGTFSRI